MKHIISITLSILIFSNCFANNGIFDYFKNDPIPKEKKLFILYRPDCPYCQNMDKAISADAVFQNSLTTNFAIQAIDITSAEGKIIAEKFNVHVVPSFVNYNMQSGEYNIIKGFAGKDKVLQLLGIKTKVDKDPIKSIEKEIIKKENTEFGVCGNGTVEAGESCDDGNLTNGDGCTSSCTIQSGFTCVGSPSVCASTCGDGIVAGGETCDDGNLVNGDGCNNTCIVEAGFNCTGSPSICSNAVPANDNCAGAIIMSGTNGTINGQNITATFTTGVPAGPCAGIDKDLWYQFTLATSKTVRLEANGPSIADPVLVLYAGTCAGLVYVICDDDSGPGSNSLIQTTLTAGTYFVRFGSFNATIPGTLSLVYNLNVQNICGNNILEPTEDCDDGNLTNGDGCSATCTFENVSAINGVSINTDATKANPSAMLDVKSFDKGILIPRMSSVQKNAIAAPAKGLMVFDITTNTFWYHNGTTWTEIGGTVGGGASLPSASTANQTLRSNGTSWLANNTLQNDGTLITVAGQIKIAGGSPGVGKILTSDVVGKANWQAPLIPSNSGFNVNVGFSGTQTLTTTFAPIIFANEIFDDANVFSGSEFTAPVDGVYHIDFSLNDNQFSGVTAGFNNYVQIQAIPTVGAVYYCTAFLPNLTVGIIPNISISNNFKLSAGNKIVFNALKSFATGTVTLNKLSTFVSGYRVY